MPNSEDTPLTSKRWSLDVDRLDPSEPRELPLPRPPVSPREERP